MIGQPFITEFIDKAKYKTTPHSICLCGEYGCGKHLFIKEICKKLSLKYVDITKQLDSDTISMVSLTTVPTAYVINCRDIQEGRQNVLLKILEEPNEASFLFMVTESMYSLLETVSNRCFKILFVPYNKDTLKKFIPIDVFGNQEYVDKLLEVFRTPGQIQQAMNIDINGADAFTTKIIERLGSTSISNSLKISDSVTFTDEKGKIPYRIFYQFLLTKLHRNIVDNAMNNGVILYNTVIDSYNELTTTNVDKRAHIDKLIYDMWVILQDDKH